MGREEERHVGGGGAGHAVYGARRGRPGRRCMFVVVVYGAVTGGVGGRRRGLVGAAQRPFSFPAVGVQLLLFVGQYLIRKQT